MTDDETQRRAIFEHLFAEHAHAVMAWAQRRDGDRDRVQDIVAETFLVAWRKLDQVPADARPWLIAVAMRVRANMLRGEHRRSRLVARLVHELPEPPVITVPHDLDPELSAAMRELAPRDRELLLLVAWDGLTPAEAARAVGCTAVAARVRLHRARARLLALLPDRSGHSLGAASLLEDTE